MLRFGQKPLFMASLVCFLLLFSNCCKSLYATDPITTIDTRVNDRKYNVEKPDTSDVVYSQQSYGETKREIVDMSAGPVGLKLDMSIDHSPYKSELKIHDIEVTVVDTNRTIVHEKKTVVEVTIYRTLVKILGPVTVALLITIIVLVFIFRKRIR